MGAIFNKLQYGEKGKLLFAVKKNCRTVSAAVFQHKIQIII
jgi:hypothetical protein